VNDFLRAMHATDRSGRTPRLVALLACLLIAIRVAAGIVCSTCFSDWEPAKTRAFYLHSGWDRDRCHHGLAPVSPWIIWACSVNEDDPAFVLPEIPHLPVLVSFFVPLVLVWLSYRSLAPVAANGRGPPFSAVSFVS